VKTEDIIDRLAGDLRPARRRIVERRLAAPLFVGALVSLALLVTWLGLQRLDAAVAAGPFWMKAGFTLALAGAGWTATRRLARPEGAAGAAGYLVIAPLAVLATVAALELASAPPQDLARLILGATWTLCPFRILALSAPLLLALAIGLRRLAPTRLIAAGASAGLLAGGVGATIYGLYCEETSAAFVVTWYSLGIGLSALMGALAGPRLLRW
jgi:hypothetical protein